MPLVISTFRGGLKEMLKELENMFEKDDLCERIRLELQKTIWMDRETIIRKVLSGFVHSSVVQGANKLLDGPSIWLYYLNWKYSHNLVK